jgi:DNA-binding response OmpR family regulator
MPVMISQTSSARSPGFLSRRRILLVEDDQLVGQAIRAAVEHEGAEVVGPIGGLSHALDEIERSHIDAAVLDVKVGGLEVFGVARALREIGIPILFVSGGSASDVPKSLRAPFLRKPFSVDRLVRTLGALLDYQPQGWRPA